MRVQSLRLPLAVVLVGLLLAGCAAKPSPASSLMKMAEHFSQRMRWQDYGHAAAFLPAEEREAFLASWKSAEDLHMVGVQIDSIEMLDPQTASVTMVLEYYQLPSNAVRKFASQQQWRYLPGERFERGYWELQSGMPMAPGEQVSAGKSE